MLNDDLYGWEDEHSKVLFQGVLKLKTVKECEDFFRDLLTMRELEEIRDRFRIARLLREKRSYLDIAARVNVSTSTVTRVAHWMKHGRGGYGTVLDRMRL
jgi:TrpR-related protein YerC/YecD